MWHLWPVIFPSPPTRPSCSYPILVLSNVETSLSILVDTRICVERISMLIPSLNSTSLSRSVSAGYVVFLGRRVPTAIVIWEWFGVSFFYIISPVQCTGLWNVLLDMCCVLYLRYEVGLCQVSLKENFVLQRSRLKSIHYHGQWIDVWIGGINFSFIIHETIAIRGTPILILLTTWHLPFTMIWKCFGNGDQLSWHGVDRNKISKFIWLSFR